jgi:diguanylate cyclase (GGDEF)-like protein
MDYRTFFFANIASVTVFSVCMSLLAWYNRRIVGMTWFAAALLTGLAKLSLQGLEGRVPPILSGMAANELYLVSFVMQMAGFHWFVSRKPVSLRWPLTGIGVVLLSYTLMFPYRIPYSGNLINIPFVGVCIASAVLLFRKRAGLFASVSVVTGVILCADFVVAGYRAVLTNLRYMRPWETIHAQTDPRWLYSLAAMVFLSTFMVMCQIWFLVTELQRELAEQARTDSLTGAFNRRALEDAAVREASRCVRYGQTLCLIMLDIDQFKQLNDTRGHAAGDCALRALVRQMMSILRVQDILARTGGEEFCILMPETVSATGVRVAERIRQAVESLEVLYDDMPIHFTVSIGVAEFDPSLGDWEAMMRRADAAMYLAKERGRNMVVAQLATEFKSPVCLPRLN